MRIKIEKRESLPQIEAYLWRMIQCQRRRRLAGLESPAFGGRDSDRTAFICGPNLLVFFLLALCTAIAQLAREPVAGIVK